MTISNKNTQAHTSALARGLVLTTLVSSLAACSTINSAIEADKVDYKGARKAAPLDVPPDLTQLQKEGRYSVPDGSGVATASSFQQQRGTGTAASSESVGAVNTAKVRVERAGTQRWLVVKQTPEQLWPQLKEFWHDSGFTVINDSATAGTMETDWAENRAKLPQDMIRNTLGKVFDSLYSTGERDKFRTRLERTADGATEVYISHRGIEEVFSGAQKETAVWTARANDPGLEAHFLARLMARLGGADVPGAKAAVASAMPQPLHAKRVQGAAGTGYVEADEGFDRAWRRVGLALDRVGFTVEDRDRNAGVYFVRFVDPESAKAEGFFSKLLNFGGPSDKALEAQRYRVTVKAAGAATQIGVQGNDGKPETSPAGEKILGLLYEQLK
ncbi:MAG: outer membrane protein assembly factor BamC [Pseudomonadota bacterium]